MTKRATSKLIEVHRIDEIPPGMTEEEEHHFWATHTLGDELLGQMEPPQEGELPPPRPARETKGSALPG